jgi:hypothetical protein
MKQTTNEGKRTQYLFKPPLELLERFKELARKNQRSTNGELIIAMERHIAQQEQN